MNWREKLKGEEGKMADEFIDLAREIFAWKNSPHKEIRCKLHREVRDKMFGERKKVSEI